MRPNIPHTNRVRSSAIIVVLLGTLAKAFPSNNMMFAILAIFPIFGILGTRRLRRSAFEEEADRMRREVLEEEAEYMRMREVLEKRL